MEIQPPKGLAPGPSLLPTVSPCPQGRGSRASRMVPSLDHRAGPPMLSKHSRHRFLSVCLSVSRQHKNHVRIVGEDLSNTYFSSNRLRNFRGYNLFLVSGSHLPPSWLRNLTRTGK